MSSAAYRQLKVKKIAPSMHRGAADVPAEGVFDQSPPLRARMHALGLRAVSKRWRGRKCRYTFVCTAGHRFVAHTWSVMQRIEPCPQCCDEAWLRRVQASAAAIGAQCLDPAWKGRQARYRFRCGAGHQWTQGLKEIKVSCPDCTSEARRRRLLVQEGLQRLQKLAADHGGVCLSTEYGGGRLRYRFRCAEGHEWDTAGDSVVRGTWCRRCSFAEARVRGRTRDGLQRLQQAAKKRGGVCLSPRYEGTAQRYAVRCAQGHEWQAFGASILKGAWCQKCAFEKRRLTIEEARQVARERGGQCLSDIYRSWDTKMSWVCHQGHHWHTTFGLIRQGHWCPECAHEAKITRADSRARLRYRASQEGR